MVAAPADCFVEVNGLRLHYLDWGGPSDDVLLLLHGITGNCHAWDDFAEHVRDDYRVLALDQRGHGASEHAPEGYPVTAFASDIAEFRRALGFGRFDLVGTSLGARNAMPYAAEHSASLRHLVLVDAGPEVERSGARTLMAGVGAERPLAFRSREEAAEYFRLRNPNTSPKQVERSIDYGLRLNWAEKLVWRHDPDLLWITGSAGAREIPLLWESCGRISCPTLILRGEDSDILGRRTVERMLEVMPTATAEEVPGAGHSILIDQPDRFERAVRAFLAG
ncbi:MAG: alpha/beta hydrolase [Chloroflexi bacterium]|nr:alpha/beta hydrolase [Chloroflexota bacterium]